MNRYRFFDFSEDNLSFDIIFLVGPCRSGKSSLGRLLGSMRHCFHIEEEWTLLMTPIMCEKELIEKDVFINMYRACINECIYDAILMRSSSFRPTDHSYIGKMKSQEEVDFYLSGLHSRQDVDVYLKHNKVTLIFNLAELNPYMHLLNEVYPGAKIVHMVRDPFIVAGEIEAKEWFSDRSLNLPGNKQVFLKVENHDGDKYVPFWVGEGDLECFLSMSSKERALYYILRQYYLSAESILREDKDHIMFVDYEDFLNNPALFLTNILPEVEKGMKTRDLIKELTDRDESKPVAEELPEEYIVNISKIVEVIPGVNKYLKRG